MVRFMAFLFGIGFIMAGLAGQGFFPQYNLMTDGLLLGYFEVNQMHNLIHLGTGVIALIAMFNRTLSKFFFILFGFFYGAATIMGFWRQGDLVMMHVNLADNYLHAFISVVSLFIGFTANGD